MLENVCFYGSCWPWCRHFTALWPIRDKVPPRGTYRGAYLYFVHKATVYCFFCIDETYGPYCYIHPVVRLIVAMSTPPRSALARPPAFHGRSTRYNILVCTLLHPYTYKISVQPPNPRPSRCLGRATARRRIQQHVYAVEKFRKKKVGKNNFIVYFSNT